MHVWVDPAGEWIERVNEEFFEEYSPIEVNTIASEEKICILISFLFHGDFSVGYVWLGLGLGSSIT